MNKPKTVLITGATGFLGRHLSDYFIEKGFVVRGLVRKTDQYPFKQPGITLFDGNLPDQIDPDAFKNTDIVIHCAYYTGRINSREEAYRINHLGTLRVYENFKTAGSGQFVFISSTGSHAEAESLYGRTKYELEQLLDPQKDLIIRPGLIIGKGEQGTFIRMKESLRKSGIVPVFGGGHQILQTIHVDDLCRVMDRGIEMKMTGVLVAAEPEGLEVRDFFKLVAAGMNKRCILVPLPMNIVLFMLRVFETLRLPFPLSSENLLGLKQMRHMPSEQDLARVGLTVKNSEESLKTSL